MAATRQYGKGNKTAQRLWPVLLACLLLAVPCRAEQEQKPTYQKKEATALISADVYDEMVKAQEAQEQGNVDAALAILDGLRARSGRKALKPYELAQMWNFYAYAWLAKEDYGKAITSFENLLRQQEVPDALASNTRFTLAQLHFAEGDVKKAIALLEDWFKVADNPGPDAYVMLAQAYTQNEQFDAALKQLLKAFDVARAQNKDSKENWYALLQYLYAEKQQPARQIEALEVLVNRWPKRNYWLALVGAYAEQGDERRQLAAMDAAYQQDMLDQEGYLIAYAQLLAAGNAPYQAARVLDKALDKQQIKADARNLERIGDYYRRAREDEKALPFLERAASAADDGETALRLAYVYMARYHYDKAARTLETALAKGGLNNPLQARLLHGQALFHAGSYDKARDVLQSLVRLASQQEQEKLRQQARQWLDYLDSEIKRQQDIRDYLQG